MPLPPLHPPYKGSYILTAARLTTSYSLLYSSWGESGLRLSLNWGNSGVDYQKNHLGSKQSKVIQS